MREIPGFRYDPERKRYFRVEGAASVQAPKKQRSNHAISTAKQASTQRRTATIELLQRRELLECSPINIHAQDFHR
jgi:hypothetical protein